MSGDPHWDDVSVLIGYDSDSVTDEGPDSVTVTATGTPLLSVDAALSDGGGAYNITGGSNYKKWVPAAVPLPWWWYGWYYWEYECVGGPATYNAHLGVVSKAQVNDSAYDHDSNQYPGYKGSMVYKGSGMVYGNRCTSFGGVPAFGAGDIVMIAFQPLYGWFYVGKNGVWEDDPTVIASPSGVSNRAGGVFYAVAHVDDPGEKVVLRSLTSQCSYGPPAGFYAIGETFWSGATNVIGVAEMNVWIEMGGLTNALSATHLECWTERT